MSWSNKFNITTPTRISVIPAMLAMLSFSFQTKTEITVVKTSPKPAHNAYAVFKGIVLATRIKEKQPTKAIITIVG